MQTKRHHSLDTMRDLDRLTLLVVARECEVEWRRLRAEARRVDPNVVTDRGIHLRAQAAAFKRLRDRLGWRANRLEGAK